MSYDSPPTDSIEFDVSGSYSPPPTDELAFNTSGATTASATATPATSTATPSQPSPTTTATAPTTAVDTAGGVSSPTAVATVSTTGAGVSLTATPAPPTVGAQGTPDADTLVNETHTQSPSSSVGVTPTAAPVGTATRAQLGSGDATATSGTTPAQLTGTSATVVPDTAVGATGTPTVVDVTTVSVRRIITESATASVHTDTATLPTPASETAATPTGAPTDAVSAPTPATVRVGKRVQSAPTGADATIATPAGTATTAPVATDTQAVSAPTPSVGASTATPHGAPVSPPVATPTPAPTTSTTSPSTLVDARGEPTPPSTVYAAPPSEEVYLYAEVGLNNVGTFDKSLDVVSQSEIGTSPSNLTVNTDGVLFALDSDAQEIYAVTPDGTELWREPITYVWTGDLVVDDTGGVYVATLYNDINKYDAATGDNKYWIGDSVTGGNVGGLEPDGDGGVYAVTDSSSRDNSHIAHYDANGELYLADVELGEYYTVGGVHRAGGTKTVYAVVDNAVIKIDGAGWPTVQATKTPIASTREVEQSITDDNTTFYFATNTTDASDDYELVAYDWADGVLWTQSVDYSIRDIDVTPESNLYVSADSGAYRHDTGDGSLQASSSAPIGELAAYPTHPSNKSAWSPVERVGLQSEHAAVSGTTAEPSVSTQTAPSAEPTRTASTPTTGAGTASTTPTPTPATAAPTATPSSGTAAAGAETTTASPTSALFAPSGSSQSLGTAATVAVPSVAPTPTVFEGIIASTSSTQVSPTPAAPTGVTQTGAPVPEPTQHTPTVSTASAVSHTAPGVVSSPVGETQQYTGGARKGVLAGVAALRINALFRTAKPFRSENRALTLTVSTTASAPVAETRASPLPSQPPATVTPAIGSGETATGALGIQTDMTASSIQPAVASTVVGAPLPLPTVGRTNVPEPQTRALSVGDPVGDTTGLLAPAANARRTAQSTRVGSRGDITRPHSSTAATVAAQTHRTLATLTRPASYEPRLSSPNQFTGRDSTTTLTADTAHTEIDVSVGANNTALDVSANEIDVDAERADDSNP